MKNTVNKKTKILRIAAGAVGVLILAVLISITHSYTGDPISKMMAKKKAIDYVEFLYDFDHADYDIIDSRYNQIYKAYDFTFQDKKSKDTKFTVTSDSMIGFVNDDYKEMVDERGSTVERLEKELADDAKNTVQKVADKWGLKIKDRFSASLNEYFYGTGLSEGHIIPPLNTPYSKELELEAWYNVQFESKTEPSAQEMADIITEFYNALNDEGFLVKDMWIEFHIPDDRMWVLLSPYNVNDRLAEKIEKGLNGNGDGSISVYSQRREKERKEAEEKAMKEMGL